VEYLTMARYWFQ